MTLGAAKSDGIRKIYKISHGLGCRQYCHIHNSIFESQQVLTVQQELFILWGYLSSPLPHTRLIVGFMLLNLQFSVLCFVDLSFSFFFLVIVLSVLLFTASVYHYIFNLILYIVSIPKILLFIFLNFTFAWLSYDQLYQFYIASSGFYKISRLLHSSLQF